MLRAHPTMKAALMAGFLTIFAVWSVAAYYFTERLAEFQASSAAIHERSEQIQAQLSEVSAVAQEALAGVRVVRAHRQEAVELAKFQSANEE